MFSRNETDDIHAQATPRASREHQPAAHFPPVEATRPANNTAFPRQSFPPEQTIYAQSGSAPTIPVGTQMGGSATYQANYAQPGLPPGTSPRAKKAFPLQTGPIGKRHLRLWLLLLAIVVFALGSGTALAVVIDQQPANTPTQALQAYCDGYKTSNAQEIYDSLSAAAKKDTSLRNIQQGFDVLKLFGKTAHISDCSVSDVQQQDTTAIGDITMEVEVSSGNFSFSTSVRIPMELVLEDHTWKVDARQTRIIEPAPSPAPALTPGLLTPTVTNQ